MQSSTHFLNLLCRGISIYASLFSQQLLEILRHTGSNVYAAQNVNSCRNSMYRVLTLGGPMSRSANLVATVVANSTVLIKIEFIDHLSRVFRAARNKRLNPLISFHKYIPMVAIYPHVKMAGLPPHLPRLSSIVSEDL